MTSSLALLPDGAAGPPPTRGIKPPMVIRLITCDRESKRTEPVWIPRPSLRDLDGMSHLSSTGREPKWTVPTWVPRPFPNDIDGMGHLSSTWGPIMDKSLGGIGRPSMGAVRRSTGAMVLHSWDDILLPLRS